MKTLLTAADIEALHGQYESRTLDIKQMPPHTSKLVQLIQGGANGVEQTLRIVIGAAEDSNGRFDKTLMRPLAYPLKPEAMNESFANFDKYRQHVIKTMRSHTNEYFEGMFEIREVEVAGGATIVIEVAQSEHRPHQNKDSQKYFIRADGETRAMDDFEVSNEILKRQQRRAVGAASTSPLPTALSKAVTEAASVDEEKPDDISALVPMLFGQREQRFRLGATLATQVGSDGADVEVQLTGSQAMYLRVAPDGPIRTWTSTQLYQMLREGTSVPLPLDRSFRSLDFERNEDGAVLWVVNKEAPCTTASAVQVYHTGEIRALDTLLLDLEKLKRYGKTQFGYIPSVGLETAYETALASFLAFMTKRLQIAPPFLVDASISGVRNYRMAVSEFETPGRIIVNEVSVGMRMDDASTPPGVVLLPFFNAVWDACGLSRPDNFRQQR